MKLLGLTAAALLGTSAVASASEIVGLYDTGVDASGAILALGAFDPHYVVDATDTPVVFTNGAYFVAADAAFIGVQADGGYTTPVNTYTLSFDLPSFAALSAQISGEFSADNYATVFLNGAPIAQDLQGSDTSNFGAETAFAATSGFVTGVNTLSFTVTDTGPPSGLEVSGLTGTYTPTSAAPEPAAWTLMLAGVGLAGAAMRARRGSPATA